MNGQLNTCPVVEFATATPTNAEVGEEISLEALGSDEDHAPGALRYAWSTSSTLGSIEQPSAEDPQAYFRCGSAVGDAQLEVTVTDGDPQCTGNTAEVSVRCYECSAMPLEDFCQSAGNCELSFEQRRSNACAAQFGRGAWSEPNDCGGSTLWVGFEFGSRFEYDSAGALRSVLYTSPTSSCGRLWGEPCDSTRGPVDVQGLCP